MKKLIALILIFGLSSVGFGASADIFNTGTVVNGDISGEPASGNYIAYYEDYGHITYVFQFTYVDSSDSYHSKPFYIGNANSVDGYVSAIGPTGTGDVNVYFHYSNDDRTKWEAGNVDHTLDAVSNTAKADTLGYTEGADDLEFHSARWMVIECAGSGTNNADDNVFNVIIKLNKNVPSPVKANGDFVRMARVASKSNTNP